jgi:hypothetical protein
MIRFATITIFFKLANIHINVETTVEVVLYVFLEMTHVLWRYRSGSPFMLA